MQEIALTSSNSYFQLGIPRIPLNMQHQWTGLGFCCKGKVSLTSPPHLPIPKNIHCVLGVPQSNYIKVAFAKCLFGVNGRAR